MKWLVHLKEKKLSSYMLSFARIRRKWKEADLCISTRRLPRLNYATTNGECLFESVDKTSFFPFKLPLKRQKEKKKTIVEQKPFLNVTATQFLADEQRWRWRLAAVHKMRENIGIKMKFYAKTRDRWKFSLILTFDISGAKLET